MAEDKGADVKVIDPAELSQAMANIAERSQRIVADFVARQATESSPQNLDPLNIGSAFMEMTAKMMSDPVRLVEANLSLWNDYLT